MCENIPLTFALGLFGVSEDEPIQEPDEREVVQRITRVLDVSSLKKKINKCKKKVIIIVILIIRSSFTINHFTETLSPARWFWRKAPQTGGNDQRATRDGRTELTNARQTSESFMLMITQFTN